MARNQGWTVVIALLVGALGASVFWLFGPYSRARVEQQVTEALQHQPLSVEGAPGAVSLKGGPSQVLGTRYQLLTDGKQVFLADLRDGRVWRYFHQSRGEGGPGREDEGFLPVALYYAGKKYYNANAAEMEAAPAKAPEAKAPEAKAPEVKAPEAPPAAKAPAPSGPPETAATGPSGPGQPPEAAPAPAPTGNKKSRSKGRKKGVD